MRTEKRTGRGLMMLLGGIGAGVVGSRLLPPLMANMMGSKRVRAGGDAFAMLIDDHRQIRSFLDDMMDSPADSTLRRSRLFLMLKRKLAKHAMAEEDVVYPIVNSHSGENDKPKHLYDEHADMKILLYELEGKLKNREDWSSTVRQLRHLILRHVDEEEHSIFPQLRLQLSQEGLPKVSGQIAREEALIV